MRLLNVHTLEFREFISKIPKYAIASHRWEYDQEITLEEVQRKHDTDKNRSGYKKVEGFTETVKVCLPYVDWIWIDTCCINRKSDPELSEAINSMYKWYSNAEVCLAYLRDVKTSQDLDSFKRSEWFHRGWTLQELLAPRTVVFLTQAWEIIGYKGATGRGKSGIDLGSGPLLTPSIVSATGIPESVVNDFKQSTGFTIEERLEWAAGRETTREEDMSYCLLGMFDVSMSVRYGEGGKKARERLLKKAQRASEDYKQQPLHTPLSKQLFNKSQQIVDWLSAPDPWTNHASARQRHDPQTGLWLLQLEQYQKWKGGLSRHLWLSGKAGCGKTILCSSVIEDVKQHCGDTVGTGYAVFYFSFSDTRKQAYKSLLRSVLAQLVLGDTVMLRLCQAYEKPNQNVPEPYELEDILLSSIKSYKEVFLLLDALDECPEDATGNIRKDVLQYLVRLTQQASNLKLFVTSRELLDIGAFMGAISAVRMNIPTGAVNNDVRVCVSGEMTRDHRLCRLSAAMKATVEETLSQQADGMFRWAYCQLQELKKLKSTRPTYVRKALYNLPSSLDETYERMLASIEKEFQDEAFAFLRWLAYAKSPPSLGELAEVAVIKLEDGIVDIDDRGSPEDALDILSGLVTIVGTDDNLYDINDEEEAGNGLNKTDSIKDDADNDSQEVDSSEPEDIGLPNGPTSSLRSRRRIGDHTKVRLAHYSVKEYLESERVAKCRFNRFHLDEASGHRFLSQSCLTYLMHYSSSPRKKSTEEDLVTFPVLQYAAQSWFYHSSFQHSDEVSRETSLLSSEDAKHDWLCIHQPDQTWPYPFARLRSSGSGLYYASFTGLEAVVRDFLAAGADVNAQGGKYSNALQAALLGGHEKVVKMLIDAGADINAQGGYFGNALQAASLRGHEKVVKMLIDAGADVNAQGGDVSNALQVASLGGYKKVVKMLTDTGADVNAQGGEYSNALQAASLRGHEEVVKMLIDAGADVNAQGGEYSNALQAASLGGYEKVVKMLTDTGADVNAQGGENSNALQAASSRGYKKVVKMLIDIGADVNAQGGHFGNALQAASIYSYEEVVKILIDAGANVNAQGGHFGNALQAASLGGCEEVVKMLIDAGADVNAQGGKYSNALQAALFFSGCEKVVKILIDAGADVNAQGGEYSNAL